MKYSALDKVIQKINARLDRLEAAVFSKKQKPLPISQGKDFKGPSGGVRLLVSKNFFKAKKTLGDVRKALGENSYYYGAAQVQTALNRLSRRAGPLAASTEGGKKVYVNRK